MHLCGHDFVVMTQGSGTYSGKVNLLKEPPKRDITMLPEDRWIFGSYLQEA